MKQSLKYPEALLEKAERLIREGKVHRVSPLLYIVREPDYAAPAGPLSYTVEKWESGIWICNCPGFNRRRIHFCSHVLAVMCLESRGKEAEGRGFSNE